MFVMYSDKNRKYAAKASDGAAVRVPSKRNLHLNSTSAHHFHDNNKAVCFLPVTTEEGCHILIPIVLDKMNVRLQDIFSHSCKVQLK